MRRRAVLLAILLAMLVLYYFSVTLEHAPAILSEQQTQTETLEQLDERVFGEPGAADDRGHD